MADGSDVLDVQLRAPATCNFPWCSGMYCAGATKDEKFHYTILSVISEPGDAEAVGVEIVCNEDAKGSDNPSINITYSTFGAQMHSVNLGRVAAVRHAYSVLKAALALPVPA